MAHGDLRHREAAGACFGREPAVGLRDDQRVPSMRDEPAGFCENAKLLTAEAEGGFGVHDERSGTKRGRGNGSHGRWRSIHSNLDGP